MKSDRPLLSEAQVRLARENIARYPEAQAIADSIIKAAAVWLEPSDEALKEMIPPPEIPRAFNSSFDGCPAHGKEAFKFGNYFWKMDPWNRPWKLVCPVGGEEYPSNDFLAFRKSGFKDRSLLTGPFADDGWGWRREGEKYKHWFVAYYCHWLWNKYLVPGVLNLSRAFVLTGDDRYARKALVILDRTAEFYPRMDHNKQSRYAQEFDPSYTGKILNAIWESLIVRDFAESYANIRSLPGLAGSPQAKKIEDSLLRVAMNGVFQGTVLGNYGMHQNALSAIAAALQDEAASRRVIDFLLNFTGGPYESEGTTFALENYIFRDGMAVESSPGYCMLWPSELQEVARLMKPLGVSLFTEPKMQVMFQAPSRMIVGGNTPTIGDTGSLFPGVTDFTTSQYRVALREMPHPLFARKLLDRGFYGEKCFQSYDDLFWPPLQEADLKRLAKGAPAYSETDNMGGYGLAMLRSPLNGPAASLYYGWADTSHGHFDRLFLEVYGWGKRLIPDLGYPQFATDNKGRTAWESSTLSHATVLVDEQRQQNAAKGSVHFLTSSPLLSAVELSAEDVYPQTSLYRRTTVLIPGDAPYLVDIFRVWGGHSHDYSIHGFNAPFSVEGLELSPVRTKGTLAGESVPYSFLYDDPDLEKPDRTRPFYSYRGSGYSYLYNIQRGRSEKPWSAVWKDSEAGIRMTFLPGQEAVIADGKPPAPNGVESLKYVLLRAKGSDLKTTFAAVLEPFRDAPKLAAVESLLPASDDTGAVVLRLVHPGGVDYVFSNLDSQSRRFKNIRFSGRFGWLRLDQNGKPAAAHVLNGEIEAGDFSLRSTPSLSGRVHSASTGRRQVMVELDREPGSDLDARLLVGSTVVFANALHNTGYRIKSARLQGKRLILTLPETIRVGKFLVEKVSPGILTTRTSLYLARSGYYRGCTLADSKGGFMGRVDDI
ncbi:MAG: heparinase II/III family protein, partial [Armatimonadetes bacterium]|nr:heparinase II/III family protein [Armatimonadota bacterium]